MIARDDDIAARCDEIRKRAQLAEARVEAMREALSSVIETAEAGDFGELWDACDDDCICAICDCREALRGES